MKSGNATLSGYGTTIFETMSGLARAHDAVNLGQGFPDDRGPEALRRAAAAYVLDGHNQYPPMMGMPSLREAIAAHDRRFYGLALDPATEVLVTSGATEALADCFLGLLEAGDEVVLLEPAYDTYAPVIRRLGAVPRAVRLAPPAWELPREELAAAFSPRTKLLVLNSPMNPTGKVFTPDELALLAGHVLEHDALVVCDEVYEHLVFGGARHVPLMTLPGMRERTVRIGSAGKTFSLTGWKVGYLTGPAALLRPITKAHQFVTFTTPPNLQHAVAAGLALDDAFFAGLGAPLARSRDRLATGLAALGVPTLPCDGTYFLVLDVARLLRPGEDDVAFCRRLVVDGAARAGGVVLIPMSAFYEGAAPRGLVRACFCKRDETIDEALRRLRIALASASRSVARRRTWPVGERGRARERGSKCEGGDRREKAAGAVCRGPRPLVAVRSHPNDSLANDARLVPSARSAARPRAARDRIGFRLLYIARRWRHAIDAELDSYGLSHATWRPLVKLAFCEVPPRQHELADALQVSEPELVRLLDNLERKGFVVRRHDTSADRRVKRIQLTPAGREIADRAAGILRRFEQRVLRGTSAAERARLADAFDHIERRLDRLEPTPKPKPPRSP